jgi:hypothetical protein
MAATLAATKNKDRYTPDHCPPVKLTGKKFNGKLLVEPSYPKQDDRWRLYPHCSACSPRQGGFVAGLLAQIKKYDKISRDIDDVTSRIEALRDGN